MPSENVCSSLALSTRSQQTIQQVKVWIGDCLQNHTDCRKARRKGPRKLPNRLISVEKDHKGKMTARLCRSDGLSAETCYLTLSHCWGKQSFLRLTRDKIRPFEDNIPIDELSPSFQDAIYLTINLGVNFLWIDSLCIIQDDLTDWEHESQIMGQIYKGALCNIAASGHANESRGFLLEHRERQPIIPPLVNIEWYRSPRLTGENFRGRTFLISDETPLHDLLGDPLYDRAWVRNLEPLCLFFALSYCVDEC